MKPAQRLAIIVVSSSHVRRFLKKTPEFLLNNTNGCVHGHCICVQYSPRNKKVQTPAWKEREKDEAPAGDPKCKQVSSSYFATTFSITGLLFGIFDPLSSSNGEYM